MQSRIYLFSETIFEWLSNFGTTFRGVAPSDPNIKIPDLYLRFDGTYGNFGNEFLMAVQIYNQRATSQVNIISKADEIGDAIGDAGLLIVKSDIRIKIEKGSPFYQDMADEDTTIRAGLINLNITVY